LVGHRHQTAAREPEALVELVGEDSFVVDAFSSISCSTLVTRLGDETGHNPVRFELGRST